MHKLLTVLLAILFPGMASVTAFADNKTLSSESELVKSIDPKGDTSSNLGFLVYLQN